jgi:hypothetical protein
MDAVLEQPVFSVGLHQYGWDDVILAARLCGDWAYLERELGEGLACVKRMEKMEEDLDGEELRAAANEFRYAHDLVSAQEAESWLSAWRLTVENWAEYLRRLVLRRKWAAQLREILEWFPVTREEMQANLWAEAVCSGRLASFAKRLAGCAAAHAKAVEAGWVESEDDHEDRAGRVRALEAGYRRFCERGIDPSAIKNQIDARRLDWIRFDCRYGLFSDEQVAREACLCLREDGADLDAIATRTGCALAETSLHLDEIEGTMRDRFL